MFHILIPLVDRGKTIYFSICTIWEQNTRIILIKRKQIMPPLALIDIKILKNY